MNIEKIIYSDRDDFKAIFVCPRCGHRKEGWGFKDASFYDDILPNAICPSCRMNEHGENEDELKARMGRMYQI